MHIAMTGSHGLVGSALIASLERHGHQVTRLVRSHPFEHQLKSEGSVDVVIHLAGESVATGRWTRSKMDRIRLSRVHGTHLLCAAIASLPQKPKVLISASAVGYYGDRGSELLTEESSAGGLFLSEVCQAWERATDVAQEAGIRVVNLRIGMVLAVDGGALQKMLPAFRFGLGGRLGSGEQYISWISLEDLVRAIHFVIENESLTGPVNAVTPYPLTNAEFTRALASVLHRPALCHVPAFLLRFLLGRMADELLLASARVEPTKLLKSGFSFHFAHLDEALNTLLCRP